MDTETNSTVAGIGDPPDGMGRGTWEMLHEAWQEPSDSLVHRTASLYLELHRTLLTEQRGHAAARAGMETQRQSVVSLRNDLTTIGGLLRQEAISRQWCDEYGTFVDKVNRATHGTWLEKCSQDFTVTVSVRFDITSQDADTAAEQVEEFMRNIDRGTEYHFRWEVSDTDEA